MCSCAKSLHTLNLAKAFFQYRVEVTLISVIVRPPTHSCAIRLAYYQLPGLSFEPSLISHITAALGRPCADAGV